MNKNKKLKFNPNEEIQDKTPVMDANEQPENEMLDSTQGTEAGVSDDIAGEYERYKEGGQSAGNYLPQANAPANTPGAGAAPSVGSKLPATAPQYSSQWNAELDSLMGQIMNREPFSYDINGDAMYRQYEDIYTRGAEAAMQNAMGQAAALTGGYGSSYGQMAGQQAYAQQMQGLYDVAPELEAQAYARYMAEGDALNQRYAMVADREAQDYQRFLDERSQDNWEKSFNYQQGRDEVADRQWQDSFEYQQSQDAQDQANWEASFKYQQDQDKQAQDNWQAGFDREGEQWDALYGEGGINNPNATVTYEGGGLLEGKEVPAQLSHVSGLTTTNVNLFDESGRLIQPSISQKIEGTDEKSGYVEWNVGGKTIKLQKGYSPYTQTKNPDVIHGEIGDGGYQPDNVASYYGGVYNSKSKLTPTNLNELEVNGVWQTVYKDGNDKYWVWDDANNEYIDVTAQMTEEEEAKPIKKPSTSGTGVGGAGGKINRVDGISRI